MSKIRDLKKGVRRVCGDLATESMAAASMLEGDNAKAMAEVVNDVANLQNNALSAISFHFDKLPSDFPNKRAYNRARSEYFRAAYRSFREKFLGHVDEIVARMNAALPHVEKKEAE